MDKQPRPFSEEAPKLQPPPVVATVESAERLGHIKHLQEIWKCVGTDCWQTRRFATYECRMSNRFAEVRELHQSLSLEKAIVVDPTVADLLVSPTDPRMNVDMEKLEGFRQRTGKLYAERLVSDFEDYVDRDKQSLQLCDLHNPQATVRLNLDGLLGRIMEVSEDSGLKGKFPTDREIGNMVDFTIDEQLRLYKSGKRTASQVRLYIEAWFRDPDKYLP